MYSGPGAAPLFAAAAGWEALAAALSSTATGCASIVSGLADHGWLGPASLAMLTAATPYIEWLRGTAAQAEQAAAQARMGAAAYEFAFASTVPPPVIAANRSLLLALVATNFFGQNSPAIAATEAHYAQMWLQDAAAMYGYAASSQAASRLSPFTEPRSASDPTGPANQSGAVGRAAATPSTTLSQLVSALPAALQQLAAPAAAAEPLSAPTLLAAGLAGIKVVNTVISTTSSAVSGRGILIVDERLAAASAPAAEVEGAVGGLAGAPATAQGTASAGMGRAALVGKLSVPAGWANAAPEVRPAALSLSTPEPISAAPGQLPVAGSVFSQSVLGTLTRDGPDRPRPKSKPIIIRCPAAG